SGSGSSGSGSGSLNTNVLVAVSLPSSVVTVTSYSPALTSAVHFNTSLPSTDNPSASGLILYVTFLLVASDGATVAVSCLLAAFPASPVMFLGDSSTPVTLTTGSFTVTVHVSLFSPSLVVTTISAVPATFAVTRPSSSTDAVPCAL